MFENEDLFGFKDANQSYQHVLLTSQKVFSC